MTAVRDFMAGRLTVFDGWTEADLRGTPFDVGRYTIAVSVYEFGRRADLLQFYVDLNSGGTVHSKEELDRVKALQSNAMEGR